MFESPKHRFIIVTL